MLLATGVTDADDALGATWWVLWAVPGVTAPWFWGDGAANATAGTNHTAAATPAPTARPPNSTRADAFIDYPDLRAATEYGDAMKANRTPRDKPFVATNEVVKRGRDSDGRRGGSHN